MLQILSDSFYSTIPPFTHFGEVADMKHYRKLPDDWIVGIADVVDSTGAIARGQYKAVNMVGASIISAIINKLLAYQPERRYPNAAAIRAAASPSTTAGSWGARARARCTSSR